MSLFPFTDGDGDDAAPVSDEPAGDDAGEETAAPEAPAEGGGDAPAEGGSDDAPASDDSGASEGV